MMTKSITHFLIILIGLSNILFSGCRLTEIDPPEKKAFVKFSNSSNKKITLKLINHPLSGNNNEIIIDINSKEEEGDNIYVFEENAIKEYFSIIESDNDTKIEIFIDDNIVKVWENNSENLTKVKNNPFNENSWEFQPLKQKNNNVVGKIIFTITEEDLK